MAVPPTGMSFGDELAEELRDGRAVAGEREAHRLAGEGDGAEARAREIVQ